MARPSTLEDKRREFLPIVAGAFAELGYRRLTSAELALRCGVGENVLYRIWADKRAMFLAALEWVYIASERAWKRLLTEVPDGEGAFLRLLSYEAQHMGEHGLYRIVFAGLSETDDPRIRAAMRDLYRRFHAFIRRRISAHRGAASRHALDAEIAAWAIVGLGTVANVGRELGLISGERRRALMWDAGRLLAEATAPEARPRRSTAAAGKRRDSSSAKRGSTKRRN